MDKVKELYGSAKSKKNLAFGDVLFVDPGLGGTGVALFPVIHTKSTDKQFCKHIFNDVLHAPSNEQWDNRAWSIAVQFKGLLQCSIVRDVVIEFPKLFSGSAKSQSSASKGDLFKLTHLIGMLSLVSCEHTGNLPILMTPEDWKGQLPKAAVINRIKKAYDDQMLMLRDHEADAIGMGVSAQGRL